MKKPFTLFLVLAIPLFCMAQNPLPRVYEYDAAGNRVLRKVLTVLPAPPAPEDSLEVTRYELQVTGDELQVTGDELQVTGDELRVTSDEFFVEKLAQVEMKIYPNPATEKITLEISNFEKLQTGVFKLYNLNGQLLKECPVHSVSTELSLAGLSAGTYLLKVNINGRVEDWKIIKN